MAKTKNRSFNAIFKEGVERKKSKKYIALRYPKSNYKIQDQTILINFVICKKNTYFLRLKRLHKTPNLYKKKENSLNQCSKKSENFLRDNN